VSADKENASELKAMRSGLGIGFFIWIGVESSDCSIFLQEQGDFADGETVVAGEHEVAGSTVVAHPFRREAAGFAGAHIPALGVVDRAPEAPGFGCLIDAETALITWTS